MYFNSSTEMHIKKASIYFVFSDNQELDPEVSKANVFGFIGCLSSVQYNHIAPLKAALRHPSTAPVKVMGSLTESNCRELVDVDVNTATTIYSSSGKFSKFYRDFLLFATVSKHTGYQNDITQINRTGICN